MSDVALPHKGLPGAHGLVGILGRHRFLLMLLLLLLPALLPLMSPGFFDSYDGRFHVYRTAALAQAWEEGVLHPRLFPQFGFGYGQAVLNFYAPLSYWPGAILSSLGFSPAAAVQVIIALGFVLAATSAYGYIRSLWGPIAGLLSALAYTYAPYHLADAYHRGAVPEHMAFVFPPLILWAFMAAFRREHPLAALLWGALAWAGLVMTHNLTALLMAPVAALQLALMVLWTRRWRCLVAAVGALVLAAGLSAVYWLPVLAESTVVKLSSTPTRSYELHLLPLNQLLLPSPFYRYGGDPAAPITYPLSWLVMAVLLLSLISLLWRWRQGHLPPHWPLLAFHLAVAFAAIFMVTTASLAVWHPLTPVLGYLQYPWRFLLLVAVGLLGAAGSLAVLWPQVRPAVMVGAMALAFWLVALPALQVEPVALPAVDTQLPNRMWEEDAAAGQVGATWTGEFVPKTVAEPRWALGRPNDQAIDGPPPNSPPNVRLTGIGYQSIALQVDSAQPTPVRLHQFHLPAWQARLDGQPVPSYPSGALGLVTVDLPAGGHSLYLRFGLTWSHVFGTLISVLAAFLWTGLAVYAWRHTRASRWLPATGIVLSAFALLLGLNGLGIGQRTTTPTPVDARLEDVAKLIGVNTRLLKQGNGAQVILYWFALREVATDYKAFVHLLDPDGKVVAQHDGDPVGGFTPTSRWQPGEIIVDAHTLTLPPDLPPDEYVLRAGLYQFEPLRNLAIDPPTPDGRVDLGTLWIDGDG